MTGESPAYDARDGFDPAALPPGDTSSLGIGTSSTTGARAPAPIGLERRGVGDKLSRQMQRRAAVLVGVLAGEMP
jgi:hypothetical protein